MAMFPITGYFKGDFVPLLVAVDTDDNMDQIGKAIAMLAVGKRLPKPKGKQKYDVFFNGEKLAPESTLGELMEKEEILPLQFFEARFRETATADA